MAALICETVLMQRYSDSSRDFIDEYNRYSSMCAANIETGLAGLPLCMKASHELVLGLFLGVSSQTIF